MSSKVGYYYQDSFAPITNLSMSVGCVAILRYKDSIIIEERSTIENINAVIKPEKTNRQLEKVLLRL